MATFEQTLINLQNAISRPDKLRYLFRELYKMSDITTRAINEIKVQYGDTVSVSDKGKTLRKFGRNTAVSTSTTTIMTLPGSELHETMITTNGVTSVVSSSASDAMDCGLGRIWKHKPIKRR